MSRELIDEVLDTISISNADNFSEILETVVEYGFADENDLCDVLDIDETTLDELVSGSDELTTKEWRNYKSRLSRYLKGERKKYERLYFSDKRK